MEESDKRAYEKVLRQATAAARKGRNIGFLNGMFAVGVIAYKDSRKSDEPPAEIARQAIAKLPENVKGVLTTKDMDTIRAAVINALLRLPSAHRTSM